MFAPFTPLHRGGSGPPLLLLHGFMDTWRTWELVLGALERRHDVLALTLPGHAGGAPLREATAEALLEGVERAMEEAGWRAAHAAGNSLGGYLALALAARGRALSVTAFAPAGGWAPGDESFRDLLAAQRGLHAAMRAAAPGLPAALSTPGGRRRATAQITERFEHIPAELIGHLALGIASCPAAEAMIGGALAHGWPLEPERIACPVRIVWGTADRLLPWPQAAENYRRLLPNADWVVLDGVGHAPQLDVPAEAAALIL